jgi:hypothetical protein
VLIRLICLIFLVFYDRFADILISADEEERRRQEASEGNNEAAEEDEES